MPGGDLYTPLAGWKASQRSVRTSARQWATSWPGERQTQVAAGFSASVCAKQQLLANYLVPHKAYIRLLCNLAVNGLVRSNTSGYVALVVQQHSGMLPPPQLGTPQLSILGEFSGSRLTDLTSHG